METNAPAGDGQDPEFMKRFQEQVQSYADLAESGKDAEAQMAALSLLMMAAEEAIKNPTPDLLLKQKADDLENRCEWGEAEKVRREILVMEQKTEKLPLVAKAQMDLSRLLRTLGRIEEAQKIAREGIASARRAELSPVLVMALQSAAFCAMEAGDPKEALALASEAVDIIEPGRIHETTKARALATRARFRLANGDTEGAAEDLEGGRDLKWEKWASTGLPGPAFALANWWETKSELERRRGHPEAACEALKQVIEARRCFESPHSRLSLARNLEKLAELCQERGDSQAEETARNEAKSIWRELKLPAAVKGLQDRR